MTDQDLCTYGNKCKNGSGEGELCSRCFSDLLDRVYAPIHNKLFITSRFRECIFCNNSLSKNTMTIKEDNPCNLEDPIKVIYSCEPCRTKYNLQDHEMTWPPASWKEETF